MIEALKKAVSAKERSLQVGGTAPIEQNKQVYLGLISNLSGKINRHLATLPPSVLSPSVLRSILEVPAAENRCNNVNNEQLMAAEAV